MPRLPYADPADPETARLAARVHAERGKVLALYRMLLHAPPVAEGWLDYLTAIRGKCRLRGDVREIVIMRIAHLNGADYEAAQHQPIARREGVAEEVLDRLAGEALPEVADGRQAAALAYCDAMTRSIRVPDAIFAALRLHFDEREIVELTATIAAYNMVSRFLVALGIDAHED